MALDPTHPDYWTQALQFTETVHRDVYPAIEPTNGKMRQIANGKVVVVTGAGTGFGQAACRQWAKAGAKSIMLATRTKASIDSVTRTLNHLAPTVQTLAVDTDVSSPDQVDHLFRLTVEQFERVDVVVHCAGVLGPLEKIGDADPGPWFEAFNINAKGTFLVARALIRAAKGADATFIHAGTAASYLASPGQSAYTASKAADNMIVDQLHIEYDRFRVFNVHPGMAISKVLRKELHIYAKDSPELFGSLTIYLAGPGADFLRGRFVSANWDVTQLNLHREEIVSQGLLLSQPFKGQFGPGGHPFNA